MVRGDIDITILVDNKAGPGLASEHGLSLWIETRGKRVLLDTGQGGALEHNVSMLGLDLARLDAVILSHGHYDHTGGLPYVLPRSREADVFYHPGMLRSRHAIRDGKPKSIGIPDPSKRALEGWDAEHLHPIEEPFMLSDRIGLTGPVPRLTSYEDTGGPFYLDPEGVEPDLIEDDLALWIHTDRGVIVCLGCAHAGPVNTLDHVRRLSEETRVRAVIGGFHLMDAGRERVEETIAALREFDPDLVVPCHCTGDDAVRLLREGLGERVSPGEAGLTLWF